MTDTSTWEALLQNPGPCDHLVQFYTDELVLARAVTRFVEAGFAEGEAAVILGTPTHRALFSHSVPDAAAAKRRGQLIMLGAAECLETFMIDGMPDRTAFRTLLASVLDGVRATGYPRARLYGEMVNLLWEQHALEPALALEELWNEELRERRLALLCAYRVDPFDRFTRHHALARITRTHSHLIPVDDDARLDRAVDRAYAEVLGSDMPGAQAALFALRDLSPTTAEAVLERARRYYSEH